MHDFAQKQIDLIMSKLGVAMRIPHSNARRIFPHGVLWGHSAFCACPSIDPSLVHVWPRLCRIGQHCGAFAQSAPLRLQARDSHAPALLHR